tara:strand:- start:294 stop:554 length:261 start_codon:yes stop_codon:yes gene_type:complete
MSQALETCFPEFNSLSLKVFNAQKFLKISSRQLVTEEPIAPKELIKFSWKRSKTLYLSNSIKPVQLLSTSGLIGLSTNLVWPLMWN